MSAETAGVATMARIDEEAVTCRRARRSDLPVLKRLFRDGFAVNWPHGSWRKVRRAVARRLHIAISGEEGHQVHVVERAGMILGYIWWQDCWAPDATPAVWVHGIGVLEQERQRGIGEMLASIMANIITRDGRRLQALVRPHNTPVVRLLEKFGAQPSGVLFTAEPPAVRRF